MTTLVNGHAQQNGFENQIQQNLNQLLTADPFPIDLLDKIVAELHNGTPQQRQMSQNILVQFKEDETSWSKVDNILTNTKNNETKYFGLQALEHAIDKRWKVLPREQCEGIKQFIITIIIEITKSPDKMEQEKTYLSKLNIILVKILKHDWPQHWPTALADIVGAAKNGESICQNNLEILRLLSEEIFEYSEDSMVQSKAKHLKEVMCDQFSEVFELCYYIMENSDNEKLVLTCLKTLLKFTTWIPLGYFFKTELISKLCTRLLPYPFFRNATLACLTEIASISSDKDNTKEYEGKFIELYAETYKVIKTIIPLDVDIREAYKKGNDNEQKLVQNLALFLSTFMNNHQKLAIKACRQEVLEGLAYLVKISYVDDVEVFKICLDYWNSFAQNLYHSSNLNINGDPGWGSWGGSSGAPQVYAEVLGEVRRMMICKMAKPEEVLVVENEQGEVVREVIKDTDSHVIYKTSRSTLVYLTHLDTEDTEKVMLTKLSRQVDNSEWSWDNLNRLCWSIGSISGSMPEEHERRFLVNVIKDLLGLCEQKRGKDNKAIIASNIMYVVGQYPRFLRAHWKFLKTVVNKLFEFMHETHDGVQDMACDTFVKIAQKCKRHFVIVNSGEPMPFIEEILQNTVGIIQDLAPHQVQVFYESVGTMISAEPDANKQQMLVSKYMDLPNQVWKSLIHNASINQQENLHSQQVLNQFVTILKTNNRACKSVGHAYGTQLSEIYLDMISVYEVLSKSIVEAFQRSRDTLREPVIKLMRNVKKEILSLLILWADKCTNQNSLSNDYLPVILAKLLPDYSNCPAEAREAELIHLMERLVEKLGSNINHSINEIFLRIFEPTLNMINQSDSDYPEHRTQFFKFLGAINNRCFSAVLGMSADQFKLVLDAIIWGMKQMMQECKETSLDILQKLLANVGDRQQVDEGASNNFYKQYYIFILDHVFEVSTNVLHAKANLNEHAKLLSYLISVVDKKTQSGNPILSTPLDENNSNNSEFVYNHIGNLLNQQFGNQVTQPQIQVFVKGLFCLYDNLGEFIAHLRDFIIQMREKRGDDTQDLFLEERMKELQDKKNKKQEADKIKMAAVPGMLNPYELKEEMM